MMRQGLQDQVGDTIVLLTTMTFTNAMTKYYIVSVPKITRTFFADLVIYTRACILLLPHPSLLWCYWTIGSGHRTPGDDRTWQVIGCRVQRKREKVAGQSKCDNGYECRQSLPDGIVRATAVMLGGNRVLLCCYGNVGHGRASAMRGAGARVVVKEIDPICALQACMERLRVVTRERKVGELTS